MRRSSVSVLAAIIMIGLHARSAEAKPTTLVVSNTGINCAPDILIKTLYTTIQAAVDAMPVAPFATNTVVVCPGTYPEQLRITKNITITGVLRDGTDPASILGNSAEVKIVPPTGGMKINLVAPSGNVAAQVAAQDIADLQLINLSIDGSSLTGPGNTERGLGCPRNDDSSLVRTAGIAFYNVGTAGTNLRGTISRSVVHNALGYCPGVDPTLPWTRSFTAEGISAENSLFTVDSSALSNVDLNVIHQTRGISIIKGNFLNFGWHGIWLTNVVDTSSTNVGSTISGNYVTAFSEGVYLDLCKNVLLTQNTMLSWTGDGVFVNAGSDNDIISNNFVDASIGVYLYGAATTVVKSNTVVRPVNVAIVDAFSAGGNTITSNTINQAPIGVLGIVNTANDVINPNTYFNTKVLTTTGPSVP